MSTVASAPPRRLTPALASAFGVAETEVARAVRLCLLIFTASAALALLKAAQGGVFLPRRQRDHMPRHSVVGLQHAQRVLVSQGERACHPLLRIGMQLLVAVRGEGNEHPHGHERAGHHEDAQ